jgi:metallophosphoesterase (TIGR00282 family)
MNVLLLGDVIGSKGCEAIISRLPALKKALEVDFVVVNAENAAEGFGLSPEIAEKLFDAGVDVLTLGNHTFACRSILRIIDIETRIVRPLNIARESPGFGAQMFSCNNSGARVFVLSALGRVFMQPSYDDPFKMVDDQLKDVNLAQDADVIILDFHCETTSEKMAMAHWCDGRVSIVVGTHTHVPTADTRILPGGTAYQTDLGMCGDYNSVIGMDAEEPVSRFVTGINRQRFKPAKGAVTVSGLFVRIDTSTGFAVEAFPVRTGGSLSETGVCK